MGERERDCNLIRIIIEFRKLSKMDKTLLLRYSPTAFQISLDGEFHECLQKLIVDMIMEKIKAVLHFIRFTRDTDMNFKK